jgi:hypothetical protein
VDIIYSRMVIAVYLQLQINQLEKMPEESYTNGQIEYILKLR